MLKVDWFQTLPSNTMRRGLIAREWVTLLWDVADKMRGQAFGKGMRETIEHIAPASVEDLNRINSTTARFWNRYGDELKHWRNLATAHRDFDGLALLEAMERIDLEMVFPIADAFNEVSSPTVSFVADVLERLTIKEHLIILKRANNSGIKW